MTWAWRRARHREAIVRHAMGAGYVPPVMPDRIQDAVNRTLANLEAARLGAMGVQHWPSDADYRPDGATPTPKNPVPPHETPDNTRPKEPTMTQHVTPQGHEAIVREDWQTDTLHVILRRHRSGIGTQYAQPQRSEHDTQAVDGWGPTRFPGNTEDGWETAEDRGAASGLTMPPGVVLRRDDAAAIHSALGEALGLPLDYQAVRDEADALAADLREVLAERDAARATVGHLGAKVDGLEDTLNATRNTLHTVRDWHDDTRRRLELAETPPILATLETTDPSPWANWDARLGGQAMWTVPTSDPTVAGSDAHLAAMVRQVGEGDGSTVEVAGCLIARCDTFGRTDRDKTIVAMVHAAFGEGSSDDTPTMDPEDAVRRLALAYAKHGETATNLHVLATDADQARVLRAVVAEREYQKTLGWTNDHDDEHGALHLSGLAAGRLGQPVIPVAEFREGAALAIAALETLARNTVVNVERQTGKGAGA